MWQWNKRKGTQIWTSARYVTNTQLKRNLFSSNHSKFCAEVGKKNICNLLFWNMHKYFVMWIQLILMIWKTHEESYQIALYIFCVPAVFNICMWKTEIPKSLKKEWINKISIFEIMQTIWFLLFFMYAGEMGDWIPSPLQCVVGIMCIQSAHIFINLEK